MIQWLINQYYMCSTVLMVQPYQLILSHYVQRGPPRQPHHPTLRSPPRSTASNPCKPQSTPLSYVTPRPCNWCGWVKEFLTDKKELSTRLVSNQVGKVKDPSYGYSFYHARYNIQCPALNTIIII